jgi:putative restriction endonuclease
MEAIKQTLPEKYSPLQANGNGNQGVYLAPVPDAMAAVLIQLLDGQVQKVISQTVVEVDEIADQLEKSIKEDVAIPITVREQLVKARVGQGLFRSRVEILEESCRITGVADRRFLRASHIKPWAKSDSQQKLDGHNGLLLAPHIDHLFDKGFISFSDNGSLMLSKLLPQAIQSAWGLDHPISIRSFLHKQIEYLDFHREHVFLK